MNAFDGHYKPVSLYNKNHIAIIECAARLATERVEHRLHCRITSICDAYCEVRMTSVELSIHIEANYPITGKVRPRKPLFGVGVNDASYMTQPIVNGVRLRDNAYRAWVDMMRRAYDQKFHGANPTYVGVTVCEEWHSFSTFRAWWLSNYREGYNLDKDLLMVGNREYGPDKCIYVPRWLNNFTVDHGASRGELPIGVSFCNQTGRYQSRCRNPITGKQQHLGRFTTPKTAHSAWLKRKLELADQLKAEMDYIDKRIYPNVVTIIKAAV